MRPASLSLARPPPACLRPRKGAAARCSAAGSREGAGGGQGKPTAVVVGGGWGGFGAAHQLLKNGFDVTLIDASDSPGGLATGWRSATGRAVEAGIKGFWYQYANIFSLVEELGLEDPFTPWTESSFFTAEGLQVSAPVFQDLPRLPAPLGTLVYTAPYFQTLPLADRLSALPLMQAMLEFDSSEAMYTKYDNMTAEELLTSNGVSRKLYDDFLEPILLVTLFAPGKDLSAAAALGLLYYYVLAHQADFDVRWCKGPVAELIFAPWKADLEARGGRVQGGRLVKRVEVDGEGQIKSLAVTTRGPDGAGGRGEEEEVLSPDAVVFAVGVKAMQGIVRASPHLRACGDFSAFDNLTSTDVMAVRLWFDRKIPFARPSNVFAFGDGVGGTFFDLNSLQAEYGGEEGSVVEVDFYHAGALLPLSDEAVVEAAHRTYLEGCVPDFRAARVTDFSVLRFGGAVTEFAPGSHAHMPGTATSVGGLFMAGDWVRQGPGAHGARGLSQEKAYVTGLLAANEAAKGRGVPVASEPLPVEADEEHIRAAKDALEQLRALPFLDL